MSESKEKAAVDAQTNTGGPAPEADVKEEDSRFTAPEPYPSQADLDVIKEVAPGAAPRRRRRDVKAESGQSYKSR